VLLGERPSMWPLVGCVVVIASVVAVVRVRTAATTKEATTTQTG